MNRFIQIGTASFPKSRHLRQQWEFALVRERALTFVGRLVVVNMIEAPDNITKVGIVVSKKCLKSAVKRNRGKRLLRESFRLIASGISPPKWIVLIARKKILDCGLLQVQKELVDILEKANALSYKKNT